MAWFFGMFEAFILLIMRFSGTDMELGALIFRWTHNFFILIAVGILPFAAQGSSAGETSNINWTLGSAFLGFLLYWTLPKSCSIPESEIKELNVDDLEENEIEVDDLDDSTF